MKNRAFLIVVTILFYMLKPVCGLHAQSGQDKKDKKAPNIIFLLTDDQRYDAMGAMGNDIIKTPNMDKMARDGMLFKNAFVTTPICSVARASFFSGEYGRRHGIWDFNTFFSDSALAQTYPMILRRHGYYSGFIGKWGVGDAGKNTQGGVGAKGELSGQDVVNLLKSKFDFWRGWPGQGQYIQKGQDGKSIHSTRKINGQIIDFLKAAPKDRPFCLSISSKAAHVQDEDKAFIPEPRLKNLYKNVTIPQPDTDTDKYFHMLPEFLQHSESRVRYLQYFDHYKKEDHSYQEGVKNYYRLVTGIDKVLGNIRDQLKKEGQAKNTVIILMGDNGMLLGEHGLTGKWYGYQESVRVPLVIYNPLAPDSAKGQTNDGIALNIDIAPTILDLAGIPIPEQMQGESLVPLLNREHPQWRNDFLFEHLFNVDWVNIPMSQGVISENYAYWEYLDHDYKPFYEQMFDLEKDPNEVHNLARNPDYFQRLEILRNRMHSLIQQKK